MGAIEDIYGDLEADVSFEEFEAAVHEKVEQMGGLADEEAAAMLVANEVGDDEVNGVADIEPGMEEVKFVAKVVSIGEQRTFERDEGEDGRVVNVEVADGTGRVRISLWDELAEAATDGDLEVGQVLRIAGRPKEGYAGVEVSVDRAEPDEDAEVDVEVLDTYRVEDLSLGLSDVNLQGRVLDTDAVRTFSRDDGSEGRVSNLTLGDETGRVRVTMWDERAASAEELSAGDTVEVVDGYTRERDGDLELHVGDRGRVEAIDEAVEYVPETTAIANLGMGETVDVAGGVIEVDPKRTFDRDDGSEGQVRNVRIKDDTDDIRVALWGDKADVDVDLGDYVVCTDVQVKDGWQDDLECSANWRSAIVVTDGPPAGAGGDAGSAAGADTDAGAGPGGDAGGERSGTLDAFDGADGAGSGSGTGGASGGGTARGGSTDGAGSGSASASAATAAADDEPEEGTVVEFTGTVVQAGDPVVLDDGEQTRSVETGERLRLGEEVTVRGPLRDGRIQADEVR
jgi:replication factor A1